MRPPKEQFIAELNQLQKDLEVTLVAQERFIAICQLLAQVRSC